jgi:hypothetical protein
MGLNRMKGGAFWALPFCLFMALGAMARADSGDSSGISDSGDSSSIANASGGSFDGSADAGVRLLYTQPSVLDSLAASAGFPKTGGLWLMWGGGATITPNPLRLQLSAWKGSLDATDAQGSTHWGLDLAALTMEQSYPWNDFIFTVGGSLEAGELEGSLLRGDSLTAVDAPLFGYSLQGGVRWPAQTMLALFLRAGWEILSGPGVWHGSDGQGLGSSLFELGGPTATLQLELSL